jgi:hypothetical protein
VSATDGAADLRATVNRPRRERHLGSVTGWRGPFDSRAIKARLEVHPGHFDRASTSTRKIGDHYRLQSDRGEARCPSTREPAVGARPRRPARPVEQPDARVRGLRRPTAGEPRTWPSIGDSVRSPRRPAAPSAAPPTSSGARRSSTSSTRSAADWDRPARLTDLSLPASTRNCTLAAASSADALCTAMTGDGAAHGPGRRLEPVSILRARGPAE